MRDLLSKLDALISETELKNKEDLQAKRKALQDLQMDPVASEDPEIKQAIIQRKADLEKEAQAKGFAEGFEVGDDFGISFSEDFEIATEIVGFVEDGIVIDLDDHALELLTNEGISFFEGELQEGLRDPKDNPCWKGYKPVGTKKKGGRTVPNCVPKESIEEESDDEAKKSHDAGYRDASQGKKKNPYNPGSPSAKHYDDGQAAYKRHFGEDFEVDEAKYRGKDVPLGKKLPGDVKKSKVYVRKPNGNIVKVNFGDKKMRIKKSNPKRRKSFRARHNCKNPGPRWKARYWSCRSW